MTLRTSSATRRRVVSRSSDVAITSDTSSNSGSTGTCFSCLLGTEPMVFYDSSRFCAEYRVPSTQYLVPSGETRQLGKRVDRVACVGFLMYLVLGTRY